MVFSELYISSLPILFFSRREERFFDSFDNDSICQKKRMEAAIEEVRLPKNVVPVK